MRIFVTQLKNIRSQHKQTQTTHSGVFSYDLSVFFYSFLLQIERIINSIYYCAPCSVAVKIRNRDEHEFTMQHINSVKHDEFLKKLSEMYIKSDSIKIHNTATSVENNIHNTQRSNCKTNFNAKLTDISNLKIETLDCPEPETISYAKRNKNCDQQVDNDGDKNITDNLNKHGENNYHEMEKKFNKATKSKLSTFKEISRNKNLEDKIMEKYAIKNSEGHTQMHIAPKKLLSSDESINSNNTDNVAAKIHFCDICSKDIPYHSRKGIAIHKSSDEHKKALDRHVEFLTTYQLVPVGFHLSEGQKHRSSSNRNRLWYCIVCCIEVRNPKTHVREFSHISMYDKLLSTNMLIKLRYNLFLCKFCDCFVRKNEELHHISVDAKHLVAKRFPSLSEFVKYSTVNDQETFNLDNFYVYSSSHTSVEMLNSPQHSKNEIQNQIDIKNSFSDLRSRLQSENDIPEIDKPISFFCSICNVNIANNEFNIKQHLTGNTHMQKAELLEIGNKRENASSVNNGLKNLDNNTSHGIGNKHQQNPKDLKKTNYVEAKNQPSTLTVPNIEVLPHSSKTQRKNLMKGMTKHNCTICNVQVPNTAYNITIHENGNPHKKKLKLKK